MKTIDQQIILETPESFLLYPNQIDELYAPQLGIRCDSVSLVSKFISNIDGVVTTEKTKMALKDLLGSKFDEDEFKPVESIIFFRTNSKGKEIACLLILNGNHRVSECIRQEKPIEVHIDAVCGNIGVLHGPNKNYVNTVREMQRKNLFPRDVDYLVGFNMITQAYKNSLGWAYLES